MLKIPLYGMMSKDISKQNDWNLIALQHILLGWPNEAWFHMELLKVEITCIFKHLEQFEKKNSTPFYTMRDWE